MGAENRNEGRDGNGDGGVWPMIVQYFPSCGFNHQKKSADLDWLCQKFQLSPTKRMRAN